MKASALDFGGLPFLPVGEGLFNGTAQETPVVKQPDACETFYVRENTPITFHLSKTTDNIPSVSVLSEELIPGSVIPVHKHLNEGEYFYFLSGSGSIIIDDKTFSFSTGTTAFVPKNTWHSIGNTGTDKAFSSLDTCPPVSKTFSGR